MTTYLNEEKKQALSQFLNCEIEEIEEGYADNYFEVNSEEYEVLTDSEADSRWDEEIESYINECILPEIPEQYQNYFDYEAFKRDAQF